MSKLDKNKRNISQTWLFVKSIKEIKKLKGKLSIAEFIEKMLKDYKEG